MRTCEHREGSITHWGELEGVGLGGDSGEQRGWGWKRVGEIPDVGNGGTETANNHGMCVPMQQPAGCAHGPQSLKYNF